jgi:hypothetical protein
VIKHFIAIIGLLLLSGCTTFNTGQLKGDTIISSIGIARTKALSQLDLTDAERKTIKEQQPKYGFYILSGSYAQYYFHWLLPDGTTAAVFGIGDVLTQPDASVKKVTIEKE